MTTIKNKDDGSITIETTEEENRKWHEEYYAKKEKNQKDFTDTTKPKALEVIKTNGLDRVEVYYSGSGDDGCIEDVTFFINDKSVEVLDTPIVNIGEWSKFNYTTHTREKTTELKTLKDYVEDVVYDFLEAFHGGWEINEGQSGTVTLDAINKKINHSYNEIIENEKEEEI